MLFTSDAKIQGRNLAAFPADDTPVLLGGAAVITHFLATFSLKLHEASPHAAPKTCLRSCPLLLWDRQMWISKPWPRSRTLVVTWTLYPYFWLCFWPPSSFSFRGSICTAGC
eukprot:TRINITY_DN3691_c0_g1_i4.p1 TRINITY_DN3691_c0_g1~~TRINITY_DN3691_c0_g1_i4.p1  ORF type:complete len:112 (+),score=4.03 TRINITY_DN3691_c0_g1_i4:546-881(+)